MLVIGTERAVFQRYAFFDQALQDGFEILRARSFPQKQMQTGFQLFDRLVGIDRFVITRNARQPIRHQDHGHERRAHARRWAGLQTFPAISSMHLSPFSTS